MTKLSKQLLRENDSYIVALKKAITEWENPKGTMKEKRDYILAIGEIGNEIYKQNKALGIRYMEVEEW